MVSDVKQKLVELAGQVSGITFVGHSLGGTAAFCLTSQISDSRGIGLNAGAAPTNPVINGPGKRFTMYHIFGDLISSHMSENAANVVIVLKGFKEFGSIWPHSSQRILKSDGNWVYSNPDEEDKAYQDWGNKFKPGFSIVAPSATLAKYLTFLKIRDVVNKSPIPGSMRDRGVSNKRKIR